MGNFKYSARSADGQIVNGTLAASVEAEVVENLHHQGLTIISINEAGGHPQATSGKGRKAPLGIVGTDEMVLFTRQLATMINSGIPLL